MKDHMSKLLNELVRRRVMRTGAVYAVAGFVTLQLGEILFPAYGVGAEGMRALVAGLIAASPLALAASWVYDVSAPRIRRTPAPGPVAAGRCDGDAFSLKCASGVVAVAILLGVASWWALGSMVGSGMLLMSLPPVLACLAVLFAIGSCSFGRRDARLPPKNRSVAVLPFRCWGPTDGRQLGESLAEEIRIRLQHERGLHVASRQSCTGSAAEGDVRELGRQLGVSTVVEGSLLRFGSEVRVTAQLVDTYTGFRVFSKSWDFDVAGVAVPQARMAELVVVDLIGADDDGRSLRAV